MNAEHITKVFTYDILFFRSVRCTQKKETVLDTLQQMVSTYARQATLPDASLPILGGLKHVRHGDATRRHTYVDTEAILSSRFRVPSAVASDYK